MSEAALAVADDLGLPNGTTSNKPPPRTRRGSRPTTTVRSAGGPATPLPLTDDGDSAGEPSCAGLGDERVAGGGDDDTCSGKTIGNGPTKACEGKSKRKASPAQIAANLRDAARSSRPCTLRELGEICRWMPGGFTWPTFFSRPATPLILPSACSFVNLRWPIRRSLICTFALRLPTTRR